MNLRDWCDVIGIDEEPFECAFLIAGVLRTALQHEPSTFEGECASLVKATEAYGRVDQPESIRKWLDALGPVAYIDVPDSLMESLANAAKEDEE